jgi:tetratricopeptide (TPR) repeat protein
MADTLLAEQKYDELRRLCDDFLSSRPHDVQALWHKGKVLFAQGDYTAAKDLFTKVAYLEPSWEESARAYVTAIEKRRSNQSAGEAADGKAEHGAAGDREF